MSHGKLREDHNCQNCGHYVEEHYCTHCGQENVETRQPFHFLFTHFIEDFVHYDGSFWQTIKKLFLKPGVLTKEYLSGKRNSSVNPVKMYIFVSFVTFFIISIFPSHKTEYNDSSNEPISIENTEKIQKALNATIDTLQNKGLTTVEQGAKIKSEFEKNKNINSLEEVNDESIKNLQSEVKNNVPILSPFIEKYQELRKRKVSDEQLGEAITEKSLHVIPKVLFVYMPLFAFFLWIFYNKKKWWYFDHGIFTLHYFTVILLSILVYFLLNKLSDYIDSNALSAIIALINTLIILYLIVYFFLALKKLYNQGLIITTIKGAILLGINTFIFSIIVIGIILYSFLHA
ncbi:DUF3667 domain-containing protein [Empedobacter falsenii]|uniref:DUF3667 domain-containing protein n=1 Tax=Empedobacter falsenii TaxID=343874 RepID=A0AAW7DMK8_9FLAO|nr:DUF3667 domain-containing protein [Empedobacter falsenii]MDM1552800.1 DUF3667 domain-containing protein [Empedobacter falsenii]